MIVLLAAALMAQPAPTLVQVDRQSVDKFVELVRKRNASLLSRARGYAFVRFKVWLPVPSGPELITPDAFLEQIKNCVVKDVSYQYGEIAWVCKGVVAKNPTNDPKFNTCFDLSPVATLRQGPGVVAARIIDSTEWSAERCGKSPIFAPPAPPLPKSKSNG